MSSLKNNAAPQEEAAGCAGTTERSPAGAAPFTLDEQIARAKAEVATWSEEKRRSVQLEGWDPYDKRQEESEMTENDIHSCSPFCERPECVKARAAVSAEASTTPSDKWKLWKNADPELLEPWYSYWASHLTSEKLHAKADIATVLALLHQQRDDLESDYMRLLREKQDRMITEAITHSARVLAEVSSTPRTGDWWCPECKEALPWNRVTFYERCDTCGTPVTVAGEGEVVKLKRELAEARQVLAKHNLI